MTVEVVLVLLVTFMAGLLPGCVPLWVGRAYGETPMRWMTGLAAGFLLTAAFLTTVPEGFEMVFHELELASEVEMSAWSMRALKLAGPGVIVLAGFLLMMAIESLGIGHAIHEEYHHHERDHGHAHVHHPRGLTLSVAIGLTVHALTDGVAIGASQATGAADVALPLLVGVITHKMPAAFSLAAFGMHELRRRRSVLGYLIIFALATPAAMYASWYGLGSVSELWIGLTLLFSAGTFTYVATVDLLPNVHNPRTGRDVLWQIILAAVVMTVLVFVLKSGGMAPPPH
ncbi:MAG: ZIP family metal transporter [Anaerolineales bacterium]|nr:ZIP family metal transporter [Anaerolineales bacterium]